jgi:hypothetical protein
MIPRICVVGAGIAGLRCADMLLQHGFKVTILEARDRIGGRMHQTTLPSGQLVDLGPNWIHGTDHNPILDLAKKTNTLSHAWDGKMNVFDEAGQFLKNGDELGEAMWGIVVQAFKHSAENSSAIEPGESLRDFFAVKVKEVFPDAANQEQKRKLVMQMSQMWGTFVGSPVERQSLKFFWLEECIDGGTLVFYIYTTILCTSEVVPVDRYQQVPNFTLNESTYHRYPNWPFLSLLGSLFLFIFTFSTSDEVDLRPLTVSHHLVF